MRVGLFSNAYKPVVSGVVNSLVEIRKNLLKRRHTPFLFAPEVRGYRDCHAGVFRFPSLDLDKTVGFPVPIPYSAKLARLVPRMGLELIHSHHPILIGASAAKFSQKLNIPLVYTFHTQIEQYTHYVPFFSHKTVRDAARNKVSRYLARCEVVICPSSSIRGLIDSYGVDTRVEVIPNAIDLSKFQQAQEPKRDLRTELGLSSQSLITLSVGRLATEKGLPFMLKVFARLSEKLDHHLVLVGDGPQRPELIALRAALGLQDRVHFLGYIPYDRMPELYAQVDLFAICSTTEVKPLVVLEALASGVPVLAVSACGTVDTLHHGEDGLLTGLDQAEYEAAWNSLLQSPSFRTKLSEGARRTARLYSIDTYTDRLCWLYQEAVESHRVRSLNRAESRRDL